MTQADPSTSLIIGASSAIAQALIKELLDGHKENQVVAISRSKGVVDNTQLEHWQDRLHWMQTDYSEQSIKEIVAKLQDDGRQFDQIFLCNGILHNEQITPEKRLQDLEIEAMQKIMQVNAFTPLLWLKHLQPLLKGKRPCVITAFSARIGSIEDNGRGGWYAYRASKAALNMLLKTAAIEIRRLSPNVKVLAFHPGTTDTPLSKPFQDNVPADKLFTPEFVAKQLLGIIESLAGDEVLHYLDWEGKSIAW